jgi:hypothetical protein
MKAPSPPPTPDPYRVAAAQQMANISVAIANTILSNADETTPQGQVRYTQLAPIAIVDPQYDSNGNQTGTTVRNIPRWERVVTLESGAQVLFDQQQQISENFNDFAIAQTEILRDLLSTPISLAALPARNATPATPSIDDVLPVGRQFQTTVGARDLGAEKRMHMDAINERLQYQATVDRNQIRARLRNQGLAPGALAWDREMLAFDKRSNDAATQAFIHAGQEQSRLFEINKVQAIFHNDVVEKEFQHGVLVIQHRNSARVQIYQTLRDIADYVNGIRSDTLKEQLVERSSIINELSALMHGGQVQIPNFQGFRPGHISDTPLGDYVYRSAAMDMQKYQMKVQQQQQMMGGLMSLGANLALAPMTGGGSLFGSFMRGM